MEPKSVCVRITGRVQGVTFRAWTADNASRLGLRGWVRNHRDGSVEALFCGEASGVDEMVQLCWRGPRFADVANVAVSAAQDTASEQFEIRPTT